MRDLDEYGLALCRYQAELFAASREKLECSSPIFLRRFMCSDVARRMDGSGFLFEAISQQGVFDELEEEFGKSSYGKIKYDIEELYWMGYTCRYWCYTYGIGSKQLYRLVKPEELRKLYYPYHSLDPAQAIVRIIEATRQGEEDYIKRGVKLLRELIEKERREKA